MIMFRGLSASVVFLASFLASFTYGAPVVSVADDDSGPQPQWRLVAREELGEVWNGATVGFKFLPRPDAVYVGFYAGDHSMTIGRRAYDAEFWEFKTLPSKVGWDSHNYVEMRFDRDDILHVSGNMHASPLNYFRASKPNDISTLERVDGMTGANEGRTTYPQFLNDREGRLLFTYRDGQSGNGSQIWNVYDESTKTWSRLLDRPLFDGKGEMNAYFVGPTTGPDGYFHIAWVWRDTPDCATNHDLSYARSRDLVHWEKSTGEALELPITLETGEIVAAIPAGGGLLNPLVRLTFDQSGRPTLAYTKYDDSGNLQIWVARLEAEGWRYAQVTNWELPWHFSGGGSIVTELTFGGVSVASPTTLALSWNRVSEHKRGVLYLDATTLEPTPAPSSPASTLAAPRPEYSASAASDLRRVESEDARLTARSATITPKGERWVFRWESPEANRDRPLPDGAPAPTTLRVFRFERQGE